MEICFFHIFWKTPDSKGTDKLMGTFINDDSSILEDPKSYEQKKKGGVVCPTILHG